MKMIKSTLVSQLSNNSSNSDREDIQESVKIILDFISEALHKADRVEVRDFGTFSTRSREKRISRNPKTGTSVLVKKKRYAYFRASKYLRESLNK